MPGWLKKILHIDLSNQTFGIETPGLEFYQKFIGGKGMGGWYLSTVATLPWNDPDMVISIFTGPLTGTITPTSGRAHIVSKSPLTGLIADSSVGGKLAGRLKKAGWDGLVIKGKSNTPVGIEINNDDVRFQDAGSLWGTGTSALYKTLNPGKASLCAIGPAAENGVRFASLIVDQSFAAGRCGIGTCFGEKKLKYIKVDGSGKIPVNNPHQLKKAREDIIRLTAASPALMGQFGFANLGTGAVYDLMDSRRMMPTDNFCSTRFAHAQELNAAVYSKRYEPRNHGCKGCHIRCKKLVSFKGNTTALPEFETMSHFTALIGCKDTDLVVQANRLCNELGMDTISAASTLACRREILGISYTPQLVLSLLKDIAYCSGEGRDLSRGAAAYARYMKTPEAAMTVKGLELPAYDPRGAYGMALGYVFSTRGGCHLRAYPISHEIFRKPVSTDRFSFDGKARIIKISEDLNAIIDSLTACKFTFFAASLEEYALAFEAVTGFEITAQDLLINGERIFYNERIINALNGFDAAHDTLPDRFFNESGTSGNNIDIPALDRDEFNRTKLKYYQIRGLSKDGLPTDNRAKSLGLVWNN
jgi:aldehyde:ferredoxin oxidoreductase